MEKMIVLYLKMVNRISTLKNLPLLLIRLVLAYGFYKPAKMKWQNINDIADWFGSLGIPAPALSAYLAAGTEAAGVVMLALGVGTRLISIPLIITMLVAIKTVHWSNGFDAGDNGFEIPLYYIIMLLMLIIYGAGRWSIDSVLDKKCRDKCRITTLH
jgi:putative oxidoreductase